MALKLFRTIKNVWLHKANQRAILFWVSPLILATVFQAYGFGFNRILPRNFVENAGTLVIILSFSLLFKGRWQKITQYLGFFVFWFNNLFESMYYYLFKANISASSIFILLETNAAEAGEFLEFYFDPYLIFMALVFLALLLFYLKKPPLFLFPKSFRYQKIVAALGVLIPLVIIIYKDFQRFNFVYLSVDSVFEYIEEQQKMNRFEIDKPIADIDGFRLKDKIDTATYVLVIGESTTRRRMSLYGYDRKTTPFLDSINSDLWVYNDVVSSHAFTIGALKEALVTNGLQSKKDFSIVQMMNEAGFKTFWISNQRPIGQYESLVTKIALSSDVYTTKNTAFDGTITPFDAVLIPEFKKALSDPASKKFIVLHPLGTHLLYKDRYPENFEIFKGKSPSNFDHKQAHQRSNSYDNAVLYHDYFLKEVFSPLAELNHKSYMIYFSDHGDEVYESIDFSGHAEENPTKSMFEVPFFIWMNETFKSDVDLDYLPNHSYRLDHFIHTLSDLNGLVYKEYDSTKSIFYAPKSKIRRRVGQGIYYDDLP